MGEEASFVAATIALRSFSVSFVADGGCCEFFFPRSVPCLLAEDVHSGCHPRAAELRSEGTDFAEDVGWLQRIYSIELSMLAG
jgi:hypothetical protein